MNNAMTLYTIFNKTKNVFMQLEYSTVNNSEYTEILFELTECEKEEGSPIWMTTKENVEKVLSGQITEFLSTQHTPYFFPSRNCEYEIKELNISF